MLIIMETQRLRLRRLNSADFDNMRKLECEADIMKFTPSRVPQTSEQTRTRLEAQIAKESVYESPFGVWAVELKNSAEFVGWFMLIPTDMDYPELGFMIMKCHWNRGFATEAAKCLIDAAFSQTHISGISARTNVNNDTSMHVLIKLGFVYDKTVPVAEKVLGGTVNVKVFHLKKN